VDLREEARPEDLEREDAEAREEAEDVDRPPVGRAGELCRLLLEALQVALTAPPRVRTLCLARRRRIPAGKKERRRRHRARYHHGEGAGRVETQEDREVEAGEECAQPRAQRVDAVEERRGRAEPVPVLYQELADDGYRPPHAEGRGEDQEKGEDELEGEERAARADRAVDKWVDEIEDAQYREVEKGRRGDSRLQVRVDAKGIRRPSRTPPPESTPRRQPREEGREGGGRSVRGVAEEEPQLPHPQNLIDQPREAREEDHQVDGLRGGGARMLGIGWAGVGHSRHVPVGDGSTALRKRARGESTIIMPEQGLSGNHLVRPAWRPAAGGMPRAFFAEADSRRLGATATRAGPDRI